METIVLDNDIKVFYVTASSFPEGIMEAHEKLHSLVPFSTTRRYFGLSRPEHGPIIYRAAVEELTKGEAEKYHCDTLILKKGKYLSITVKDYADDVLSIKKAFDDILSQPDLDPQGYCVEWYLNQKDVRCMVRAEN